MRARLLALVIVTRRVGTSAVRAFLRRLGALSALSGLCLIAAAAFRIDVTAGMVVAGLLLVAAGVDLPVRRPR